MRTSHWVFWVIRPRFDVRLRNRLVEQRPFPARSFARTHRKNHQDEPAGDEEPEHQPEVVVGRQDARDEQDEPEGRQHGADGVEGRVGFCRQRVLDIAAQHDDQRDDHGLEDEGPPPAQRGSDEAADEGSGCGADAAGPP